MTERHTIHQADGAFPPAKKQVGSANGFEDAVAKASALARSSKRFVEIRDPYYTLVWRSDEAS